MIRRDRVYFRADSSADSPAASHQLEAEGYALVEHVFSEEEISLLHEEVAAVFKRHPADARSARRSPDEDEMFRYEMFNRSPLSQKAIGKQALLDVIEPMLGDNCHVIANTAWRNAAGFIDHHGGGGWHIDAGPHVPLPEDVDWPTEVPHPVFAIGVHIFLEDCGPEDGPTGVIPGSHLSGRFPPFDEMMNEALTWKGQGVVSLHAKAGDVALFVSDVWHRRMPTGDGDTGRFFLQVHYGRRDIAQRVRSTSTVNHVSDAALSRTSCERERQLLGIHANGFYDA